MVIMFTIGDRIRELREAKKLSQSELAEKISVYLNLDKGISERTIGNWESGKTTEHIELRYILALSDILECDLEYLCNTDIEKHPAKSKKAQISSEYTNLSLESIKLLHDNSKSDVVICLDYLFRYYAERSFTLIDSLLRALYNHSTAIILSTLTPEYYDKHYKLVGGYPTSKAKMENDAVMGMLLRNGADLLNEINPVHLIWCLMNYHYSRGEIEFNPMNDYEDYKSLYEDYEMLVNKRNKKRALK